MSEGSACRQSETPWLKLADVLGPALSTFSKRHRLPAHHWKVFNALLACRTGALGAHRYRCTQCGGEHLAPHACRNRHCPSCQGVNAAEWFERQSQCLLPVRYFHVVFTLPHSLNPLIAQNQRLLYQLLFQCASSTLLDFGRNNWQAQIGLTAVLHTWGQTLIDHYHLHCIVPAGGISLDHGRWVEPRTSWLFSVRALSEVFRARYLKGLRQLFEAGKLAFHGKIRDLARSQSFEKFLAQAARPKWVVYSKRPFAGPQAVLKYLSRYTHRVGITNRRLLAHEPQAQTVTFKYRDYAEGSRQKSLTLRHQEFVRRLALHILPRGFVRIRHFGFLSNRNRSVRIAQLQEELKTPKTSSPTRPRATGPIRCPRCGGVALKLLGILLPPVGQGRSPPPNA